MAIFSLLAAALLASHIQSENSIYAKLFPVPTGTNGYEEYALAADQVKDFHWNDYE